MYDVLVAWHSGREKLSEGVEGYDVVPPPQAGPSPGMTLTYAPNPPHLVLTGGAWQEVRVPLDSAVAFWSAAPSAAIPAGKKL